MTTTTTTPTTAGFAFHLQARDGEARAGEFTTPHGTFQTPVFMPVGTQSTVKTLTWPQVRDTGARIVLANAYHLFLRPGHRLVEQAGGLHGWMNWPHPILTDSGGFQVFSLAHLRQVEANGVRFQDPVNGDKHFVGPKESMAIQNALGADIIMAFDECPPYPVEEAQARESLALTHRWLAQCWEHHARAADQALFPIVQGSVFRSLREEAAAHVQQYPAVGYAIGGVSVGEPRPEIHAITSFTAPLLPVHKPRYLMGVGTLPDLLEAIRAGVDMMDCVLPTRNARHGGFFTPWGNRSIRNKVFEQDFGPLVEDCACFACQHHSRAYIRHLFRQGETTAKTLLSIHNVQMLVQLTQQARQAIVAGRFADFYDQWCQRWNGSQP